MAVYLFTFHAYRSWRPDNPCGYVKKHQGILPPDSQMAKWYDRDARHPPIRFDAQGQKVILDTIRSLPYRLHYLCATSTHVHVLISWKNYVASNDVRIELKRKMGQGLSKALNKPGPWFCSGRDSHKRVVEPKHFEHLMETYLPKKEHRGLHFSERRGLWRQ